MRTVSPTVLETMWNEGSSRSLWAWLTAIFAVCLMTAAAKVDIPFYPVPLTLQSMACVMIGLALGPIRGAAAIAAYVGLGAIGLPVFAGTPEKGIGLAYMVGPTGGYLLGFFFCAIVTGWLARNSFGMGHMTALFAGIAGLVALYLPGLIWLGTLMGWDKPILDWGLWPFLPGEGLKLAIIAMSWPMLWRLLNRAK